MVGRAQDAEVEHSREEWVAMAKFLLLMAAATLILSQLGVS